jgi:hypothetical protein
MNANVLLKDLVSKDYITIVYKNFTVCFSVLIWAIRMVSHKIRTLCVFVEVCILSNLKSRGIIALCILLQFLTRSVFFLLLTFRKN